MEKIKLLHISETFVSGVYTYIKQICNYLENNDDFEVHIIYSADREETKIDHIPKDFSHNIILHEISMKREISPKNDFISIFNIRKEIKKINPDIIHLHSSKAGILGRIASYGLKSKVFYTPHGFSFLREDITKGKQNLFYFIEKYTQVFLPVQIVACGDQEYRISKKIDKNSKVILNGVNLNLFCNFNYEHAINKPLVIGTSGRISIQKNPKLFNNIAKEFPLLKFCWIGDGDLKSDLIEPNIYITGWKNYDEGIELLKTFDIFISTSLWEGLPFNILEAMALKKPIISNNIEGNLITVEQGVNGYLCNTIEEFKNSIELTSKKISEMGDASYKRVSELFNQEKNIKELINLYIKTYKN
ncbi:glycosyltransferase [Chishuiella sp.]|uniref:glycosyltransferase n=1 Tax=Chishuiella sp. TaxID=1969467 RepID=UPI0028B17A29|nr:glycosyltransferase [Chishuiella sp.]